MKSENSNFIYKSCSLQFGTHAAIKCNPILDTCVDNTFDSKLLVINGPRLHPHPDGRDGVDSLEVDFFHSSLSEGNG